MQKFSICILMVLFLFAASQVLGQTVTCVGTESGGNGNSSCQSDLKYAYIVDPGGIPTFVFVLGTEDGNPANYTNICMPDGWSFMVQPRTVEFPHKMQKTAHGSNSTASGECPYIIKFSSPSNSISTPFTFGFDHPASSHDVSWWLGAFAMPPANMADWEEAVGEGLGPIHGPKSVPGTPGLTPWGILILVVLLLAAGLYVIRRRRVTA